MIKFDESECIFIPCPDYVKHDSFCAVAKKSILTISKDLHVLHRQLNCNLLDKYLHNVDGPALSWDGDIGEFLSSNCTGYWVDGKPYYDKKSYDSAVEDYKFNKQFEEKIK